MYIYLSQICSKDTGSCATGCPDTHVGTGCDVCLPTLAGVDVLITVAGSSIQVNVNSLGCDAELDVSHFDISITFQTRMEQDSWQNLTTRSLRPTLSLDRNSLLMNTQYELRAILFLSGALYSGYTEASNTMEFYTGCDNMTLGDSCSRWCNCSVAPSQVCILTIADSQCVQQLPIYVPTYEATGTSITVKASPINSTEQTVKVKWFNVTIQSSDSYTKKCDAVNNKLDCTFESLLEYTNYNFNITPIVEHDDVEYISIMSSLDSKTRGISYYGIILCVTIIPTMILIIASLTYLAIKLKRRRDKIRAKEKYMNMCDLSKIDTTIDTALDEKIKQLPKYPDLQEYLLMPEDSPTAPAVAMRKSTSMNNVLKVDTNSIANGTFIHNDVAPPRLVPRRGSKSKLPTVLRRETFKRHGSDTKLTNSVIYSNSTFKVELPHDDILQFDDLEGIPIPVSDLKDRIDMLKGTHLAFEKEYRQILNNAAAPCNVSALKANKPKNRYIDITPYDHSRVVLPTVNNDVFTDYINASYIDGYGGQSGHYIASQAPKPNTVKDMWRLIWHSGANLIIMLTNVIENGRQKSERYWPRQKGERYGKIEVTPIAAEGFAYYVQRKFLLRVNREIRIVTHLQFTAWPDHGVPQSSKELLNFYYKIKAMGKLTSGPWITHCSAGIGRTGSFIAIDYLLTQAAKDCSVDVYKCVGHMRVNRFQMVQTADQYRFIYESVLESLTKGDTGISIDNFNEDECRMLINSESIKNLIENGATCVDIGDVDGRRSENTACNRQLAPIPPDQGRPHLSTSSNNTGYINAVYVDSYCRKNAFIATQIPLQHTQDDFWRMVFEQKCSGIVLLNYTDDESETYWPQTTLGTLTFEEFSVTLNDTKTLLGDTVIERQFTITNMIQFDKDGAATKHEVCHWQLLHWPEDNNTTKIKHDLLLSVNEFVEKYRNDCASSQPVVVQCMNGVDRCDLYVTLCYVLQKMSSDGVMDVPFAIRQIRTNRPQFITSLHHIRHICDVVLALNSDNLMDYANEW